METETKRRLLAITEPTEFMRVLREAFPDKKVVSAADLGEEVFSHMLNNVLRQSVENHADPRKAFAQRKRGN